MTPSMKTIICFLLIFASGCERQRKNITESSSSSLKKSHTNPTYTTYRSGLKTNGACIIDTLAILANKNLPQFMGDFKQSEFVIERSIAAIPNPVMKFLKCTHGGSFTIANPGEEWKEGCTVLDEGLPDRELVFIAKNDCLVLLVHYIGGIAKSEHLLIFRLRDETITDFWCGVSGIDINSFDQVLDYLEENKDQHWGLNTNIIYF